MKQRLINKSHGTSIQIVTENTNTLSLASSTYFMYRCTGSKKILTAPGQAPQTPSLETFLYRYNQTNRPSETPEQHAVTSAEYYIHFSLCVPGINISLVHTNRNCARHWTLHLQLEDELPTWLGTVCYHKGHLNPS